MKETVCSIESGLLNLDNADHRHMPCGGNDSWSRAHLEEYLIKPGKYCYSLRLQPITSSAAICRPPPLHSHIPPATHSPPPKVNAVLARGYKSSKAFMAAVPIVLAERIVELASFKVC